MAIKKGIVFSLDVMLALITAMILISAGIYYMNNLYSNIGTELNLNQITQDSLEILDFKGDLINARLTNSNSTLNEFLNELDNNICAEIEMYNQNDTIIMSSVKSGCVSSNTLLVSRRTFIVENDIYYAKMEGWFK